MPTASCAPGPKTRSHWNMTQQKPVPNQNPMSIPRRPVSPDTSAENAATASGAAGHQPTGAKARFSAAPASRARAASRTACALGRRNRTAAAGYRPHPRSPPAGPTLEKICGHTLSAPYTSRV